MGAELLARSFASTRGVLANVRADQLTGASTPCASWDVRALVNHIVGGTTYFAVIGETGSAPSEQPEVPEAAGPEELLAEFDDGAARAVRAFDAEGTAERTVHLPFGDLSGSAFVHIASVDTFTHGWDLAKATGQPTHLAPDLAGELLEIATGFLPDALRGPDGKAPFGPKVDPPAGASAADQLAAFLGRTP